MVVSCHHFGNAVASHLYNAVCEPPRAVPHPARFAAYNAACFGRHARCCVSSVLCTSFGFFVGPPALGRVWCQRFTGAEVSVPGIIRRYDTAKASRFQGLSVERRGEPNGDLGGSRIRTGVGHHNDVRRAPGLIGGHACCRGCRDGGSLAHRRQVVGSHSVSVVPQVSHVIYPDCRDAGLSRSTPGCNGWWNCHRDRRRPGHGGSYTGGLAVKPCFPPAYGGRPVVLYIRRTSVGQRTGLTPCSYRVRIDRVIYGFPFGSLCQGTSGPQATGDPYLCYTKTFFYHDRGHRRGKGYRAIRVDRAGFPRSNVSIGGRIIETASP